MCIRDRQDVFGHQNDRPSLFLQAFAHTQNAVVFMVFRQAFGQLDRHAVGFHPQLSAAVQPNTMQQIALHPEVFQRADNRPRIGAALTFGTFQPVQFFQNDQRQHHIVFLKTMKRIRRLNQYIGI